ncbi:MAG: substrate-binding domain-containing protein [Clostridiales bacterium]|jgi:ABC-type sugar transport system substrate-binding protein|nr:substrate-binding domain-containing protein [Clostridiales bacterium]
MFSIRKVATLSLGGLLLAGVLSSCSGSKEEIIGVALPNTSTTLNARIGEAVEKSFEGKKVQVQSADNDVSTQISQINGFVTMGANMIVVVPTEIEALEETLANARQKGIKIVVSGASAKDDAYDAITNSNEYLVGSYIALLGKHWVEENLAGQSFDTLILCSDLNEDGIARSNGMKSITEKTLPNGSPNPAYCELVANNPVHTGTMGLSQTGNELISGYLTQYPNIKLALVYMSGVTPGISQYIVDGNYNNDEYAVFSGGVQGNEQDYLIGSISDTEGIKSVFRGAVSFGGADAAQGVADLAFKVYNGAEGVDYQKQTTETIGVWYVADGKLACFTVDGEAVKDFDPKSTLADANTVIKWPSN